MIKFGKMAAALVAAIAFAMTSAQARGSGFTGLIGQSGFAAPATQRRNLGSR